MALIINGKWASSSCVQYIEGGGGSLVMVIFVWITQFSKRRWIYKDKIERDNSHTIIVMMMAFEFITIIYKNFFF